MKSMAIFIVITDIISMIVTIISLNCLLVMQENYTTLYDDETVEMKDFTVKTYGMLPKELCRYENEIEIKFAVWDQIQHGISMFLENDRER